MHDPAIDRAIQELALGGQLIRYAAELYGVAQAMELGEAPLAIRGHARAIADRAQQVLEAYVDPDNGDAIALNDALNALFDAPPATPGEIGTMYRAWCAKTVAMSRAEPADA